MKYFRAILLPSTESFKKGCCQLQAYVQEVLVNMKCFRAILLLPLNHSGRVVVSYKLMCTKYSLTPLFKHAKEKCGYKTNNQTNLKLFIK